MSEYPPVGSRAIVTKRTWKDEKKVPQEILDILKRGYSTAHYEAMAKLVEEKLEGLLNEAGVKCKLSRRVKQSKSLQDKLVDRVQRRKEGYKDFQEIKRDIADLAGVRIILYMPTKEDHTKVDELIKKQWGPGIVPIPHPPMDVVKQQSRIKPEEGEEQKEGERWEEREHVEVAKGSNYQPLHLGYRAVHYRVPMKETDTCKAYSWLEDDRVEVQVVSALTHAWAEVGHDILYKSLADGRPSLEERRILDALNGLIQSGDLLLEQFQSKFLSRTSDSLNQREDFKSFLRGFLKPDDDDRDLEPAELPRSEGIYLLYKFLVMKRKNTPSQIRAVLESLKYPCEHLATEREIRSTFYPVPTLAADMSLVVCFIREVLFDEPYVAPQEPGMSDMCAIMMSALTTLDFCLGGPEEAKSYLQKMDMTVQQVQSINFLLESPKRYDTLLGELEQEMARAPLKGAWDWFRTSASTPASFCGFLFRLAEMGCRKDVKPVIQLSQLQIAPLSRSNTSNLCGDTTSSSGMAQPARTTSL